jgi:uncharacterized protein YjiS (DUF1127 family)
MHHKKQRFIMAHMLSVSALPAASRSVRPSIMRRFIAALRLSRERRALHDLDDHLLTDIGLTRDEARIESERDVWDVPANWTSR